MSAFNAAADDIPRISSIYTLSLFTLAHYSHWGWLQNKDGG